MDADSIILLYPHIRLLNIGNTVIRKDYQEEKCPKLISGGPCGHEPMYSGYVGRGMLTAAIQGGQFESPTTYEILNVIKEVSSSCQQNEGVLFIIENTSCLSLNFSLASEKAISEGINVKIIATDEERFINKSDDDDDIKVLPGTIILQKIAGSMIDGFGKNLVDVFEYCTEIQKDMTTVLIPIKMILIPNGNNDGADLKKQKVVQETIQKLNDVVKFEAEIPVVALINNVCCSILEEHIVTSQILRELISINVTISRVYVGTFLTCCGWQGITLTVLKNAKGLLDFLDYTTETPSWKVRTFEINPQLQVNIKPRIQILPFFKIEKLGPRLSARNANILLLVIQFACDALISCRAQLNAIDAESSDGDAGSRLEIASQIILEGIQKKGINVEFPYACFKMIAKVCDNISGCVGAVYSIVFESCANTFANLNAEIRIDEKNWLSCLQNAINAVSSYTLAEGKLTKMVSPLEACYNVIHANLQKDNNAHSCSVLDAFECGVATAEEAACKTKASHKKYPDAGAHSLGICLRAIFEGVKFRTAS